MLELLVGNINEIKLYFFILLPFLLIPFYVKNRIRYINKYVVLLILIFIFILIHSFLFSFHQMESVKDSLYALLVITDLYLLVSIIGNDSIYKHYHYLIIVITIILVGTSDFILLFNNSFVYYHNGNFHGILQNSNTLALYLGVFIAPYMFFFTFCMKNVKKILFLKSLFLLNMFYILLLTRSRASLVIFMLVGVFFYVSGQKNKLKKMKAFGVLVIIILSTFSFAGDSVKKYINKNENTVSILSTRTILWDARLDAIKEKPYVGWGYNVNEYTYIDRFNEYNKLEKGNTFLALLEEFGLIFGSAFIMLFTLIFYKSYKRFQCHDLTSYLAITIVAVLLHSLLETWIFNFYSFLSIIFWILVLASFQNNNKGKV